MASELTRMKVTLQNIDFVLITHRSLEITRFLLPNSFGWPISESRSGYNRK
jgi:hypothetical protein